MLLYLRLIECACAGAPGAMEGNNVNRGDVFCQREKSACLRCGVPDMSIRRYAQMTLRVLKQITFF